MSRREQHQGSSRDYSNISSCSTRRQLCLSTAFGLSKSCKLRQSWQKCIPPVDPPKGQCARPDLLTVCIQGPCSHGVQLEWRLPLPYTTQSISEFLQRSTSADEACDVCIREFDQPQRLSECAWSSDEDANSPMVPASLTRVSCNGINVRRRRFIAMACGVVNGFMRLQGSANSIRPQGHAARPYSQPHHKTQGMQLRTSTYCASSSNGASSNDHPSSNGSLQNGESHRSWQTPHIQRHGCHEECSLQRQPPRAHAAGAENIYYKCFFTKPHLSVPYRAFSLTCEAAPSPLMPCAGAEMNGYERESPFSIAEVGNAAPASEQQAAEMVSQQQNGGLHQNGSSSAEGEELQQGNGNAAARSSPQGMHTPRVGETLDSMDASDLWLDAGAQIPC